MAPYFIRNLIPKKEPGVESQTLLRALASLTFVQWLQLFCGWLAWTCDAIDFFSVSLSVSRLQDQFNRTTHDIVRYLNLFVVIRVLNLVAPSIKTTAITLTLLFRSVGAVSQIFASSLSPLTPLTTLRPPGHLRRHL